MGRRASLLSVMVAWSAACGAPSQSTTSAPSSTSGSEAPEGEQKAAGVDVQALVVSAGVIGIVVGLGAQALIRDLLTGIFLLFEGLLAVGDEIKVGDV